MEVLVARHQRLMEKIEDLKAQYDDVLQRKFAIIEELDGLDVALEQAHREAGIQRRRTAITPKVLAYATALTRHVPTEHRLRYAQSHAC